MAVVSDGVLRLVQLRFRLRCWCCFGCGFGCGFGFGSFMLSDPVLVLAGLWFRLCHRIMTERNTQVTRTQVHSMGDDSDG